MSSFCAGEGWSCTRARTPAEATVAAARAGLVAAARGHRAVATELHPSVLELARFNLALNGRVGEVELRAGPLFEPVARERFDRILAAPHYPLVYDKARLMTRPDERRMFGWEASLRREAAGRGRVRLVPRA